MRFLNVESEEDAEMIATIDPVMEQAILALRTMSNDNLARQLADMREAQMHDAATYLEEARDEGRAEGIEEGRKQGTCNAIKMLLSNGADHSIILSTFKLTDEELQEIIDTM